MDVWSYGFSVIVDKENLEEVLFGPNALFLEGAPFRSFIVSAVELLKKTMCIRTENGYILFKIIFDRNCLVNVGKKGYMFLYKKKC